MRSRGIYGEHHWRNSLSEPYNKIVPPILGVAFLSGLMGLLVYLLVNDHLGWAALVGLYLVYHYVLKLWQVISRTRARRKLFEYIEMLSIITHDVVTTDSYDVDTIIRRLKACEEKELFPFSVIFPLLELRKKELR